jgi:hypothetical protein
VGLIFWHLIKRFVTRNIVTFAAVRNHAHQLQPKGGHHGHSLGLEFQGWSRQLTHLAHHPIQCTVVCDPFTVEHNILFTDQHSNTPTLHFARPLMIWAVAIRRVVVAMTSAPPYSRGRVCKMPTQAKSRPRGSSLRIVALGVFLEMIVAVLRHFS